MGTLRGTRLGDRASSKTLPVLAGDICAILIFVGGGILQHNTVARLVDVVYLADTVTPFLLGWALAATIAGAYTIPYENAARSALRAGGAWVLAAFVGQGLRSTPLFHGSATASFIAVSVVVGGALIVGWRVIYAVVGSTTAR